MGQEVMSIHSLKTYLDRIETANYNGTQYKVMNDTWYNVATDDNMIRLLEQLRKSGERVRFHWGDTETGLDWGDQFDVSGRVSRSWGPVKIPLLVHNRRSLGGRSILSHCILKITYSRGKQLIYQHPKYHTRAAEQI